jgi:hypothetical protein
MSEHHQHCHEKSEIEWPMAIEGGHTFGAIIEHGKVYFFCKACGKWEPDPGAECSNPKKHSEE